MSPLKCLFAVSVALVICSGGPMAAKGEKATTDPLEVPSDAAQKDAVKLVKEAFKDAYAKTKPEDKRALLLNLLDEAENPKNTPAAQYVVLSEVERLATELGDVGTALQSIAQLSSRFKIKKFDRMADRLREIGNAAKADETRVAVGKAYLGVVDLAASEDAFDEAEKMLTMTAAYAQRTRDNDLRESIGIRRKQVRDLRQEWASAQKAEETLTKNPEDPQANLEAGKYRCFIRGDWKGGLPLLAKSTAEDLKQLALTEIGTVALPDAQAGVGDGWWALSEKAEGLAKSQIQAHAIEWYRKALPGLEGLKKKAVESRIEAKAKAAETALSSPGSALGRTFAMALNNLSEWNIQKGKWSVSKGALVGQGNSSVTFKHPLPPNMNLEFILNVKEGMRPRMYFDGCDFYLGNEGFERQLNLFGQGIHKTSGSNFPYDNNREYKMTFRFKDKDLEVLIDGKQAFAGRRKSVGPITLRLSGGDDWSKGTTCFSKFVIEPLQP
jgi:hypothetical protein